MAECRRGFATKSDGPGFNAQGSHVGSRELTSKSCPLIWHIHCGMPKQIHKVNLKNHKQNKQKLQPFLPPRSSPLSEDLTTQASERDISRFTRSETQRVPIALPWEPSLDVSFGGGKSYLASRVQKGNVKIQAGLKTSGPGGAGGWPSS